MRTFDVDLVFVAVATEALLVALPAALPDRFNGALRLSGFVVFFMRMIASTKVQALSLSFALLPLNFSTSSIPTRSPQSSGP